MDVPRIGPREVVYENSYQQVYRVHADFGAFSKEYYVTDYGWRTGLIVVRGESILLVQQYRLLIDGPSWEIPGGRVDRGETPEVSAVRECLEETGVRCKNLTSLITFHPGLDTLHNPTRIFLTHDFSTTDREPQPKEVERHEWVPLSRCLDMINGEEMVDSLSILGLLTYHSVWSRR